MYYHVYCQKWLDSKRPTLEATSFEGYQYRINIIKKYFSENPILVTAIKPQHIKDFFDYLLVTERTVGKKTVQSYSNRTIKDVAMLVRATLAEAVKLEIIAKNPAISIKTPKRPTEHTQRAYIGIDELSTFMQAISGHRLELPFTLALYYGLRREEILGLRWSSIRNDKIYIEHTVSRVNTTVAKNRTKTDASYREYPLTDAIRDKLEQIRDKQNYCRQMFGEKYCRSDYIFTWEDGRPYSPDYLTKSFKKLVLANETLDSTLTLHSLRASCVSLLIHSGVDIKDVQQWVGHRDVQTTLNIYARTNEKQQRQVANKMSDIFFAKNS